MEVTPTPLNEKLIVQYLLGELSEEQQVEIEDCAFQDQECMASILSVESDLIDEYVRGEISPNQLDRFENHFLASAERRRKVEFAQALAAVTAEQTTRVIQPAEAPSRNIFRQFFASLSPAPALAFAATVLVLVFGAIWLFRDVQRLRAQVSQLQAENESQRKDLATERARVESLANQLNKEKTESVGPPLQQIEPQVPGPTTPTTVALLLLPGLARGSGNEAKLVLQPGVDKVVLRVGVDPRDDYQHFRIELRTAKNVQVFAQNNLLARSTRGGRTIFVSVPARLLTGGRYELALKGAAATGSLDDVGFYYFEIVKK